MPTKTITEPLNAEQLRLIDAYWRVANYLSAGELAATRAAHARAYEAALTQALGHDAES